MRATDVLASLRLRWPDSEYLSIEEAPQDSSRQGRKLDLLVLAYWQSRGLSLDGVEVKVSASDWLRELKNPAKAEFWWKHVNRFWLAVPPSLVERARSDLPTTWGLLCCPLGEKPTIVVKAPHHEALPMKWPTLVGLLRAASDAGANALSRAEARGREEGRQHGLEEAKKRTAEGRAERELESLRQRVREFEEAAGIDISRRWGGMESLGAAVRLLEGERHRGPGWIARSLGHQADAAVAAAERLLRSARESAELAERVQAAIVDAEVEHA